MTNVYDVTMSRYKNLQGKEKQCKAGHTPPFES